MKLYFKGEEQRLSDVLEAREIRAEYQEKLLDKYKMTIVSYKLNIPGPIKYSPLIKMIFDEGLGWYEEGLVDMDVEVLHEKVWYKNSGPEYFAAVDIPARLLKRFTVDIEVNHPLGRLFDFDIITSLGNQVSREEFGLEPRKCLICGKNAFECGRSREHGVEALVTKIETMANEFFRKE